ncbi:MAG TPA: hypothetical protein VJN39_02210 [Gemmatimonadales bacterium]|nr:hypothetical protein [Gemmatimonadales bacterium]
MHWGRGDDRVGIGMLGHGLSSAHEEYLARGGRGFLLGDGRLNYGHETIFEGYYRDRGPVSILSLRLNLRY